MCSTITCFFILQHKLAALVWVTNFGRMKVILPVESETGQEIIFRTSDILPVQVHKGFIGAFIEVSKLRDTLNISAIYSLGQVLQKEDRNEKWCIFLAAWLAGEGGNATRGSRRTVMLLILKQNKLRAFAFGCTCKQKFVFEQFEEKHIASFYEYLRWWIEVLNYFKAILRKQLLTKQSNVNASRRLVPLEPLPFNFNRTIFVSFCFAYSCHLSLLFFVLNC